MGAALGGSSRCGWWLSNQQCGESDRGGASIAAASRLRRRADRGYSHRVASRCTARCVTRNHMLARRREKEINGADGRDIARQPVSSLAAALTFQSGRSLGPHSTRSSLVISLGRVHHSTRSSLRVNGTCALSLQLVVAQEVAASKNARPIAHRYSRLQNSLCPVIQRLSQSHPSVICPARSQLTLPRVTLGTAVWLETPVQSANCADCSVQRSPAKKRLAIGFAVAPVLDTVSSRTCAAEASFRCRCPYARLSAFLIARSRLSVDVEVVRS